MKRSNLAGWAGYAAALPIPASSGRLRLHLVATLAGLPINWAPTDPKIDKRQVLTAVLDHDRSLTVDRSGLTIMADRGDVSSELDTYLAERGVALLRPPYRNRVPRPGEQLLKPVRQLAESIFDTLKGQLDLELHGGRSIDGVGARIGQRLLAMTARSRATGPPAQPITRSLTAFDH